MLPRLEGEALYPDLAGLIRNFASLHALDLAQGLIIALSGGADSTSLLFACSELSLPLAAVYIDHRLRPDTELRAEWQLVQANAARAGVSLVRFALEPGEVDEYAKNNGCGIEAAARAVRYRLLERERSRLRYEFIATGHTADDVAETMCARFFQGSGLTGLHGIPPVRPPVIRPLLGVGREEIISYLSVRGIEYSEDSSNAGSLFQRNRIRSRVLPAIAAEFPAYRSSLIESAAYFEEENSLLFDLSRERLSWKKEPDYAEIDFKSFFAEPAALRIRSLIDLLEYYSVQASRIPRRFLAVSAASGTGSFRHEGHGFSIERRGAILRFTPSVVFHGKTRYVRKVAPGETGRIGPVEFLFDQCREKRDAWSFRLAVSGDCSGLIIRNRRSSDLIRLPGGTKSLKSFFADQKIPEQLRDSIPVVFARKEVIALAASLYGFRDLRIFPEGESIPSESLVLELRLVE